MQTVVQNHMRGRVLHICGDIIYLEMGKTDGTSLREEKGPFASENARLIAHRAAEARLRSLNDGPPPLYTNSYLIIDADRAVMKLDAECSDDPTKLAIVSVCDLSLVLRVQWGAKRFSNASWCAYTDSDDAPAQTLHDYVQASLGKQLVRFANGDALDCTRPNMISCPPLTPPDQLIRINSDEPDSTGHYTGLTLQSPQPTTYKNGRWRLVWTVGGKQKFEYFPLSSWTDEEKNRVKEVALAMRASKIEAMKAQNTGIETWADQHPQFTRVAESATSALVTRNTKFQLRVHDNDFYVGSHLRGRVSKHGL